MPLFAPVTCQEFNQHGVDQRRRATYDSDSFIHAVRSGEESEIYQWKKKVYSNFL